MKNHSVAYNQLSKFVGKWHTEGLIPGTHNTPVISIKGTDTYMWIVDGYFLLHTADVTIGDDNSQTHEIIGYDYLNNHYTMQHYNNKGNSGLMTATVKDNIWTFVGDDLRFTGGFNEEEDEFTGIWEHHSMTSGWSHLMNIKLSKKVETK